MNNLINKLPRTIGTHHLIIDLYENTIGYIKYAEDKKYILKMVKYETLEKGTDDLYNWGIKYNFIHE